MLAILAFLTLAFAADISVCTKPYCKSCSLSETMCNSCIDNYILVEGECKFKRDLGCEIFNQFTEDYECTTCADGYKHNGTKCEIGKELCEHYETEVDFECSECISGYLLGSTECLDCSTENKYCVTLDASFDNCTKCTECAKGTKLNAETGICEVKDQFCALEITEDKCTQCVAGYYVGTEKCEKGTIPLCEQYDTKEVCVKCFHDSILKDGNCTKDENCVKYGDVENKNENKCVSCKVGFGLVEGECKQCQADAHCQYCNGDVKKCSSCDTTTVYSVLRVSDSLCVACNVTNCMKCVDGDETKCSVCNEKYGLIDETQCELCNATNCKHCNADINTCNECYDNDVIVNSNCVDCVAAHCSKCVTEPTPDQNKCFTCDIGFAVDANGECQPCSDENCLTCSPADTCTSCSDGFGVSSGDCVSCEVDYCAKCSTSSATCTFCKTDYTLTGFENNHCYEVIDFCTGYKLNGETEECTSCENGYALIGNKCVFDGCDNGLADNRFGEKCSVCIDGYFLTSEYRCVQCDNTKCPNGCVNATTECIQRNDMREIDYNCRLYDTDNICIECYLDYTLKDGKCDYNYKECEAITVTGKCTLCHDETTLEYWPSDDFICYVEPEEVSSSSNGNNSTTDDSSSNNGNDPKDNGAFMNSLVVFFLMAIMLI